MKILADEQPGHHNEMTPATNQMAGFLLEVRD
jgi:hypothetical protein